MLIKGSLIKSDLARLQATIEVSKESLVEQGVIAKEPEKAKEFCGCELILESDRVDNWCGYCRKPINPQVKVEEIDLSKFNAHYDGNICAEKINEIIRKLNGKEK